MGIEFELKFRATEAALWEMRQHVAGTEKIFSMETTYYDAPDGSLSAKYYTLRRRMENNTSVCTLKTPAKGQGRNEFEVECNCIEEAIPKLCKLSGENLPQSVVPVCGAKFTRIAKTVVLTDCTVEVALDQGVLSGGGREIPLCEAEVELKAGNLEGATAYAAQLAIAFNLTPETKSKFRRAKELAEAKL